MRLLWAVVLLANGLPALAGNWPPHWTKCTEPGPPDEETGCPVFGSACCVGQGAPDFPYPECGGHPRHNVAYGLRVGHADIDCNTGLIYNAGPNAHKHPKYWFWMRIPEELFDWCTEVVPEGDPEHAPTEHYGDDWGSANKLNQAEKDKFIKERPWCPQTIRCIDGSNGMLDCAHYPKCKALCDKPTSGEIISPMKLAKNRRAKAAAGEDIDESVYKTYSLHPRLFKPENPLEIADVPAFDAEVTNRLRQMGYTADAVAVGLRAHPARQGNRLPAEPKPPK